VYQKGSLKIKFVQNIINASSLLKRNTVLYFLLLIIGCFSSCSTLKYTSSVDEKLPELGSVGLFKSYALGDVNQSKGIVNLAQPILLRIEKIKIAPRDLFKSKDSVKVRTKDSTLIRLSIVDNVSLLQQLNSDQSMMNYLKQSQNNSVVTSITLDVNSLEMDQLMRADELYLVKNRETTLSVEMRDNGSKKSTFEFSQGIIVSYNSSEFCWGQNRKNRLEIFDLVPNGNSCNDNLYKTAKKAKVELLAK